MKYLRISSDGCNGMRRSGIFSSYPSWYEERNPGEGIFTGDGDSDMFVEIREDEPVEVDADFDDEYEEEE